MKCLSITLALLMALFPLQILAESAQVRLVSPSPDDDLTGKSVEIAVSYNTGSSEKVTYVELLIDGERYTGKYLEVPQNRGVCSFLWDTTSYANGNHSIIVKVFAGSKLLGSVSGGANLGNKPVDVIPPTISFFGIKSGETVTGARDIKLQARDNSGKPPIVSVSVDKNLKLIKNTPPYSFEWDTTAYDNGKHTVEAWGYDEAGNRGDAGALTLVVKNAEKPAAVIAAAPAVKEAAHTPPSSVPSVEEITAAVKEKSEPVVPSISAPSRPETGRVDSILSALPEIAPGLAAPPIHEPTVESSSIVVNRAVEVLTNPANDKIWSAGDTPVKVTSPGSAVTEEIPAAKDSNTAVQDPFEVALAEPSVLESASVDTEEGTRVSLPQLSAYRFEGSADVRSSGFTEVLEASGAAAEPAADAAAIVTAMTAVSDAGAVIDPLDIPASTTAPQLRLPAPEVMAMRSSAMTFESPVIESSPTRPALPVMTPHTAPIKAAASDVKGLEAGIEEGMAMMAPTIGGAPVKVAKLPSQTKPVKKAPKVIRGKVDLVMDDDKVLLRSEAGKDTVPLVALRKVMSQLGGLLVWDNETKSITAYNHGVRITMKVGEPKARVNGKQLKMACPVMLQEDQAYGDLKFLKRILKMELEYNPETGEFTLKSS